MLKNWMRFFFFKNTLTSGMALYGAQVVAGVDAKLEQLAKEMEEWAQDHAPWEDRTGEAREGLTAETYREGPIHGVILYHTVDYGIWLEIRWSGTYAIIMPTIEHFASLALFGIDIGPGGIGDDLGEFE